jgi:hypothetical protein
MDVKQALDHSALVTGQHELVAVHGGGTDVSSPAEQASQ